MYALSLSATRRRDKVVILTGPSPGLRYSTPSLLSTLPAALRRSLSLRGTLRAIFSTRACVAAAVIVGLLMLWDAVTIDGSLRAQRAAALDLLLFVPWGIASALRAWLILEKKGGRR